MNKAAWAVIIAVIATGLAMLLFTGINNGRDINQGLDKSVNNMTSAMMTIESPAFKNNERIPDVYTCKGKNINPPLKITGAPESAKGLVLVMDDPDAPMGTFVHWTLWNVDPKTAEVQENSIPKGAVEGVTSFGKPGYGGPCPPSGTHRYFFKLYALDSGLSLSPNTKKSELEEAIGGHVLSEAVLIGLYGK